VSCAGEVSYGTDLASGDELEAEAARCLGHNETGAHEPPLPAAHRIGFTVEYVEAIDQLLGFVDREVLIRVSHAERHPGFVLVHGMLAQGERDVFSEPDDRVSVFPLGDRGDALYIYREAFTGANYDGEAEALTIWLGPVAISIEPA
jgi:hypothetical protein